MLNQRLLKEKTDQPVPAWVRETIKSSYYACHAANRIFYHELENILASFHQDGIPVILLKGIYLAKIIYGDIGLRPMDDIDLLVSTQNLVNAIHLLEESGFKLPRKFKPEIEIPLKKHSPILVKAGKAVLELHWSIVNPENSLTLDENELWSRARSIRLAHSAALALSPEDLLLHLCIHASYQHYFFRQIRSLCDIAEVIDSFGDQLDWDQISARSHQWNAGRGLWLTLTLVQSLLKAPIPEHILSSLQTGNNSQNALAWAGYNILQTSTAPPSNLSQFLRGKNIQQQISGFFHTLFPPPLAIGEIYSISPGSWQIFLHYPPYWLNRIARYWLYTWQALRGDQRLADNMDNQINLSEWLNHKNG